MKCRRCGEKAVINMRQHKLALCKEHYLDWLPEQVERAIQKYHMFTRDEQILVAVSGGKDSLSLWDILDRLEYKADGLYIGLGIDGGVSYSAESQHLAEKFAAGHNLRLHVVDLASQYGETIPELAARTHRGRGKPCSVCGLSKRHIMNRVAHEGEYAVLVTGHNLDDEAAVLFGNTLTWSGSYLVRQAPVLPADQPGLARKAKPLCRIYEREMAAYALLRGIEYIYDECPFAVGSTSIYYKDLLNKLEGDRPGAKLSFYLSFLQAKENGLFSASADQQAIDLHACLTCGQPTTAPGLCAFCRMFSK
ncbi:MAG TPA: ATP-binding protein [Anaerolineales bacterium]|nr:ATP-binding protein [Anaerolineales bacterium]